MITVDQGRRPARSGGARADVPQRHRFVTADGTALFVTESGPADAPVTLLLVHAWTQDHTEWDPILPALRGEVRVLRHDHRGHGASDPASPETATIAQLADDLAELIAQRVPSGPIVLAGHSMGGMTLMALAERHPDLVAGRVAGVALVATSCDNMDRLTLGLPGPAGRAAARMDRALGKRLRTWGEDSLPLPPRLAAPGVKWLAFGKRPGRDDVRAMTRQVLRAHPSSVGGFRDSISRHDRRAALAALRDIPAVVLAGGRDRITPVEHAKVMARELPGARFVLFPKAGHELTYERTEGVAQRLNELLDLARTR
jgi:pimeloyl-ACP methyl ester carboxylesterase